MAHNKVSFKDYQQNQMSLLPPSLEELIPADHPVRVVNEIIDRINIDNLLKQYKGGGSSSFHPRMLLKVLVYAYLCNTYSSRKIEEATRENIHFMWLAGMARPDHNTVNRFRSEKLGKVLREVFGHADPLYGWVPMYPSGWWSWTFAALDGPRYLEARSERAAAVAAGCEIWSPRWQGGAFEAVDVGDEAHGVREIVHVEADEGALGADVDLGNVGLDRLTLDLDEFDRRFRAETRARGHEVPGRDLIPLVRAAVAARDAVA